MSSGVIRGLRGEKSDAPRVISTMDIRKELEYRLRVRRSSKNEFVCTTTSGRPSQGPLELRGRLPPPRVLLRLPVAQVLLQARERKHVRVHEIGDHLCGNQPVRWVPWLSRAARNRHRHAIEQASRRWRGGRRDDSARTRRKILISTQGVAKGITITAGRFSIEQLLATP